jgi:hypothetical protein
VGADKPASAPDVKSLEPPGIGSIRTGLGRNFKTLIAFPRQFMNRLAAGGGTCNCFRGGI